MTRLSRNVKAHEDEYALSLASRLATANGMPLNDFCRHLGLDPYGIADGQAAALRELAYLADVDPSWLSRRAAVRADGFFEVSGERLLPHHVNRKSLRFCPHCLAADRAEGSGDPNARTYVRLPWLVTFIGTCAVHAIGLLTADFHDQNRTVRRFSVADLDYGRTIEEALPLASTAFETYFTDRLFGVRPFAGTFLDKLPLHVAGRVCELVGGVASGGLSFKPTPDLDSRWIAIRQAGYGILQADGRPFEQFLTDLAVHARAKLRPLTGRMVFGYIYTGLRDTSHRDYDCLRDIVRDVALDTLPIGPSDEIFGKVEARRFHSIRSASKEIGVSEVLLGGILQSAGIITAREAALPPNGVLLPVAEMTEFARRLSRAIERDEVRRRLCIKEIHLEKAEAIGLIAPFAHRQKDGVKTPLFDPREVNAVLLRLSNSALGSALPPESSNDILRVREVAGCTFAEIIGLLLEGRLTKVGRNPDFRGLMAIQVDPEEVREVLGLRPPNVIRFADYDMGGRLHERDVVELVERGYLHCELVNGPDGTQERALAAWSVEVYEERYLSLYDLGLRLFTEVRNLRRELEGEGIMPVKNNSDPAKVLYDSLEVGRLTER